MTATPHRSSPPASRWSWKLIALAVVYAGWLIWLAYVAWVNTTAGNQ